MMKPIEKQPKYERCILCGQQTDVLVNMPVMDREHYIEATGSFVRNAILKLMLKRKNIQRLVRR